MSTNLKQEDIMGFLASFLGLDDAMKSEINQLVYSTTEKYRPAIMVRIAGKLIDVQPEELIKIVNFKNLPIAIRPKLRALLHSAQSNLDKVDKQLVDKLPTLVTIDELADLVTSTFSEAPSKDDTPPVEQETSVDVKVI